MNITSSLFLLHRPLAAPTCPPSCPPHSLFLLFTPSYPFIFIPVPFLPRSYLIFFPPCTFSTTSLSPFLSYHLSTPFPFLPPLYSLSFPTTSLLPAPFLPPLYPLSFPTTSLLPSFPTYLSTLVPFLPPL